MSKAPKNASEDLIDSLVGNLTPAKPLRSAHLWLGAGVAVILAALCIFFVYGPRPEIRAWLQGVWTGTHMMWLKPLLFLAIGAGALWSVSDLAQPQGRLRRRTFVPLAVALAVTGIMLVSDLARFGPAEVLSHARDPASRCVATILCGGLAGFIVMWQLWLRRSATSHPALLGTMSGLAAAALMAAAYAVHCNMDTPVYILVIYGAPVALLAGVTGLLGRRLFRW